MKSEKPKSILKKGNNTNTNIISVDDPTLFDVTMQNTSQNAQTSIQRDPSTIIGSSKKSKGKYRAPIAPVSDASLAYNNPRVNETSANLIPRLQSYTETQKFLKEEQQSRGNHPTAPAQPQGEKQRSASSHSTPVEAEKPVQATPGNTAPMDVEQMERRMKEIDEASKKGWQVSMTREEIKYLREKAQKDLAAKEERQSRGNHPTAPAQPQGGDHQVITPNSAHEQKIYDIKLLNNHDSTRGSAYYFAIKVPNSARFTNDNGEESEIRKITEKDDVTNMRVLHEYRVQHINNVAGVDDGTYLITQTDDWRKSLQTNRLQEFARQFLKEERQSRGNHPTAPAQPQGEKQRSASSHSTPVEAEKPVQATPGNAAPMDVEQMERRMKEIDEASKKGWQVSMTREEIKYLREKAQKDLAAKEERQSRGNHPTAPAQPQGGDHQVITPNSAHEQKIYDIKLLNNHDSTRGSAYYFAIKVPNSARFTNDNGEESEIRKITEKDDVTNMRVLHEYRVQHINNVAGVDDGTYLITQTDDWRKSLQTNRLQEFARQFLKEERQSRGNHPTAPAQPQGEKQRSAQSSKIGESEQSSQRHSTHTPTSTPTKNTRFRKIKNALNAFR